MKLKKLSILGTYSFLTLAYTQLHSMEHAHTRKHLLPMSSTVAASDNIPQHTEKKVQPHTHTSSLPITPYIPEEPIENDDATQFGLRILDNGTQVGHIRFELFPEENEEDEDDNEPALTGEINFLYVEETCRGQQYGKNLLDAACTKLQELGCQKIVLTASPPLACDLEKLVRFYQKAGFKLEEVDALATLDPKDEYPGIAMYKLIHSEKAL